MSQNLADKLKKVAEDYERDGYAVIENFLNDEEIEALKKESFRLVKEESAKERERFLQFGGNENLVKSEYYLSTADKVGYFFEPKAFNMETKEMILPEEQSIAKIAHAIHSQNPVFKSLTTSQKAQLVFKEIGFTEPTCIQSMVIFKNPRVGEEYLPHRDTEFLATEPIQVAGLWMALDDADEENGCLEFIPGSHKGQLERRFVRCEKKKEDGSLLEWTAPPVKYDESKFKPAPVKRGGAVLLHGLVVHRSAPNTSDKARLIYTFHCMDKSRATWLKDNWLQPQRADTFMPIFVN